MDSFLMWQKYYSSMLTAISYFFLAVGIHILFRVATRPALRHESWSVLSILELLLPACQFLSEPLFGANLGPGWPCDPIWPFSNHWGWEEQPLDTQCTLFFLSIFTVLDLNCCAGFFELRCTDFSPQRLLLCSTGCRAHGVQSLRLTAPAAPRHMRT